MSCETTIVEETSGSKHECGENNPATLQLLSAQEKQAGLVVSISVRVETRHAVRSFQMSTEDVGNYLSTSQNHEAHKLDRAFKSGETLLDSQPRGKVSRDLRKLTRKKKTRPRKQPVWKIEDIVHVELALCHHIYQACFGTFRERKFGNPPTG